MLLKEIWILIALAMPPGAVEHRPEYIIGSMETASKADCITEANELLKEWNTKVTPTTDVSLDIHCVPKETKEETKA